MKKIQLYVSTIVVLMILSGTLMGCKKFLDARPDKSLVIPSSLQDLMALLDNNSVINQYATGLGEASSDNYYLTDISWAALNDGDKNIYIWGDELFYSATSNNEWQLAYRPVYYANLVLENLEKISKTAENKTQWDNIKGSALFIKALSYHMLVTTFSEAYDNNTAASDYGIPLRPGTDFNETSVRSSVEGSYREIEQNLLAAVPLLPVIPDNPMKPSKPAAYALLARTYLTMRQYEKAGNYADSCLNLKNSLMDFNGGTGVSTTAAFPFSRFNPEVIYHTSGNLPILGVNNAKIDPVLYSSYQPNDLRLIRFFKSNGNNTYSFKGSYLGSATLFTGIAVDEVYLIKAESLARQNLVNQAMIALNTLLIKRWTTGTFVPLTATTSADAIAKILIERRKELLMRNLRWMDIKRLNKEGSNIALLRNLNNKVYNLAPNENRFALPLPQYILDLTKMPQNPR